MRERSGANANWLKQVLLGLMMAFAWFPVPVLADEIEVDAELVLAVDVSRSMTTNELEIQRRGYAEALSSDEVISAITSGLIGRVAVQYVEWAGEYSQRIIVDWTLIASREDAEAFAERLVTHSSSSMRRTSISGGINFAANSLDTNRYFSNRRIIDVSGDGPNNQGVPVTLARDEALAKGIIINGLPLMTREGIGIPFQLDDLDRYYEHCVIGGQGSFVLPVLNWDEFPTAVRQKLLEELAGISTHQRRPVILAQASGGTSGATVDGYDCLIGEKIWDQWRHIWSEP